MKIAIIGAGWVGCHLTKNLSEQGHDITLFEEKGIFSSTSFYNQNRLHLGFHYPRNYRTRLLCKETFDKFENEYGEFTEIVNRNIYSIPDRSMIDYGTFKAVMSYDRVDFEEVEVEGLLNLEGSVLTGEKYINFQSIKTYFEDLLKDKLVYKKIENVNEISSDFDFVINCTNNALKNEEIPAYYEAALSLIYTKIGETNFDSLTLMDGNFFSIYPYVPEKNLYTLTDVEYTPLYTNESIGKIDLFLKAITKDYINSIRLDMEEKVKTYFPQFEDHFRFNDWFTSIKVKTYNQSADRYPIISVNRNVISCFTGKIQGIYIIENKIKEILKK